ncbi:non-homologous end-joining factor 1 [Drosophila virilis]|uniref:Uncharacterized protein n=1 Tax=Drosophila virilis TaxID=7244 RepID=B4MEL7_DROVI|nr:uncharacterized protein LOC6636043 [Drosophila virilis]EDW62992.1 uncharacterized protein Dvir_GJ14752 [Drosophila virilis]
MTLKIIQLNDVQLISCLSGDEENDEMLQFYCHDQINELSYCENLPVTQFQQRIRELNKRVHFPIKAVRTALSGAHPAEATLRCVQHNGTDVAEPDREQQPEHQELHSVLSLKYRIVGAPAPLKWEWHLTGVDSAMFYRYLLKDALHTASYLNENLQSLLDVVKKKDIELKQYRIEGAQLRRTTVATEPYDVEAFHVQHKQLLAAVAAYVKVGQALDGAVATAPIIKNETAVGVPPMSADVATTIPCSTAATSSAKSISPRNRKRKAMETGIQHVERKVLQRRRVPQLQYKNTESQESDLEASLAEAMSNVKAEAEIKQEPSIEIPTLIDPETNPTIESTKNELDEIMQLINRTAEQTNKMLEEHNVT